MHNKNPVGCLIYRHFLISYLQKGRLLADNFYSYLMPVVSDIMEYICIIKIQWVA